MSQANEKQVTAPNMQDKRKPAPGVLPKNAQTWVVMGLTTVIILMLWISGPSKSAKSSPKSDPAKRETVAGLSPAEIGARLEEERREQETPAVPVPRPLNSQSVPGNSLPTLAQQGAYSPAEEDPIKQDMRKREYTSRFSSSVALTYRAAQMNESAGSTQALPSQVPADISELEMPDLPGPPKAVASPAQTGAALTELHSKRITTKLNQATGKDYVVFEGTVLETALVTRLNGDFSGPVVCMLTSNIYSHDGQHLLMPAGTKVMGETKRVEGFGQTRLAVIFHRLIMPDGYSVDLDQFHGLSQVGETGLKDQVNHHYLQIFGASIAVGALGGLAAAGTNTTTLGTPQTEADAYRQGVATSFAQSSTHILDKFLNLLPTITIREGHRVKVYLTEDLLLPDYVQHEMPSNL
jgi:type IV secretion system protein VirB10